jgi:hypothetical protein
MSERVNKPSWDTSPLSERFPSPAQPVHDVAFGHGQRFTITDDEVVSVEVFPGASVTRVCTEDVVISFHRSSPPRLGKNGVVFENTERNTFLLVLQDGTVGVRRDPAVSSAVAPSETLPPANDTKTPPHHLKPF